LSYGGIVIAKPVHFDNPTNNHQFLALGYNINPAAKDLEIQVFDPYQPDRINNLSMNLGLLNGRLYLKIQPDLSS